MKTRTVNLKLDKANRTKLLKLDKVHKMTDEVARKYLKFKKDQLKRNENNNVDFKQEFKDFYKKCREKYPGLNSAVLQNTMRWIEDIIQGFIKKCKTSPTPVNFPQLHNVPVPLRNDNFYIKDGQDTGFEAWLRVWRTNFPLHFSDYSRPIIENADKFGDSSIIKKKDGFILRLVCKNEDDEDEPENKEPSPDEDQKVIGVDLGIDRPITCSDGKVIGNGSRIKHKKKEFGKRRAKQQNRKKQISAKQSRWTTDKNHKLSRQLVDYLVQIGADVLVLEDLQGNHLANRKWRRYKWAFRQLKFMIEYKARAAGIKVIDVDPAYTSQTCSRCGHKSKDNRHNSRFECLVCGFKANADVNAAKNIRNLFRCEWVDCESGQRLRRLQTRSPRL